MILITVYIASFFLLAHLIEPGAVLERVHFLSGNLFDPEDSESKFLLTSSISIAILATMFLVFSSSLAAFAMVTSEICARVMRPASTISLLRRFHRQQYPIFQPKLLHGLGNCWTNSLRCFLWVCPTVLVAHEYGCGNDSGNKQRGKKACCNKTTATD